MAREPGGWRDYQEDVERHRGERATTYAETLQVRAYRDLYGYTGDDPLGRDRDALRKLVDGARSKGLEQNLRDIWEAAHLETVLVNQTEPDLLVERMGARWVSYVEQFVFVGDNSALKAQDHMTARRIRRYEESLEATEAAIGARPAAFNTR